MNDKLELLKKLVFDGGFDKESRQEVLQLESRLQELATAEKIAELPAVRDFIDYLDQQAKQCTHLLANDRSLTELQRQVLFEKRDICERFSTLFTGKARESLEAQINDLLNVAKDQNGT